MYGKRREELTDLEGKGSVSECQTQSLQNIEVGHYTEGGGGGLRLGVPVFKILKLDTIQKKKITYRLGSPLSTPTPHPILRVSESTKYLSWTLYRRRREELTDLEVGRGKGGVSECQSLQNTGVRHYIIRKKKRSTYRLGMKEEEGERLRMSESTKYGAISSFSPVGSLSSNGLRMRVCVCLCIALA